MKKKIISSLLAVAMMFSIAIPAVSAASSDVQGSYAAVTKITEKEGKDTWTMKEGESFNIEDKINVFENNTKLVLDKSHIRYELNGPTGEYNGFKVSGSTLTAQQAGRNAVITIYDNYNKSTTNARLDIKLVSVAADYSGPAETFTFVNANHTLPVTVTNNEGIAEFQIITIQAHPAGAKFTQADKDKIDATALPQIATALKGDGTSTGGNIVGTFDNYNTAGKAQFEIDYLGAQVGAKAIYTVTIAGVAPAAGNKVVLTNTLKSGSFTYDLTAADLTGASDVADHALIAASIVTTYNAKADRLYNAAITAPTVVTLTAIDAGVVTLPDNTGTTGTTVTATVAEVTPVDYKVTGAVPGSAASVAITPSNGSYLDNNAVVLAIATANKTVPISYNGKEYVTNIKPGYASIVQYTAVDNGKVTSNDIPAEGTTIPVIVTNAVGGVGSVIAAAFNPVVRHISTGGTGVAAPTITYDFAAWAGKMPVANTLLTFGLGTTVNDVFKNATYTVSTSDTTPTDLAANMAARMTTTQFTDWTAAADGTKLVLTHKTATSTIAVPSSTQLAVSGFTNGYTKNNIPLTSAFIDSNRKIEITVPADYLNQAYRNYVLLPGEVNPDKHRSLDSTFAITVTMDRLDGKLPAMAATSTNAIYTKAIKAASFQIPQNNIDIKVGETIKIPVTYYPPNANVRLKSVFEIKSVLNNGKAFEYAVIDSAEKKPTITTELKIIGVNSTDVGKANLQGQVIDGALTAFATITVKPTDFNKEIPYTSKISASSVEVEVGASAPIAITGVPAGVTVKWVYKDDGSIILKSDTTASTAVVGKKVGVNKLTATLSNGEKFTCDVTVKAATVVKPDPDKKPTEVPQTGDTLFSNLF